MSVIVSCKNSGIHLFFKMTIKSVAPNKPVTTPANMVPRTAITTKLKTSLSPWAIITSNVNTASDAPIGSMIMPSHLNIEATEGFSFICFNKGIMTVGPVTTKIVPSSMAIFNSKSKR